LVVKLKRRSADVPAVNFARHGGLDLVLVGQGDQRIRQKSSFLKSMRDLANIVKNFSKKYRNRCVEKGLLVFYCEEVGLGQEQGQPLA